MTGKPKSLVLRGSGLNCNFETARALELSGSLVEQCHVNDLISGRKKLDDFHIFVIPGGFSYGDDLGSGTVLGNRLKFTLGRDIEAFIESGRLLVGICNGFQVLVRAGFLPGNFSAALCANDSGRFEDRWVYLKPSGSLFTKGIERLFVPVNHGEGRFWAPDAILMELENNGQVVLRYCDSSGKIASAYPENPNGSALGIAGITNKQGNVLGMMPHPEKYIFRYQHPMWTRMSLPEEGDGLAIFRNMVGFAGSKLT